MRSSGSRITLDATQRKQHPECWVCSQDNSCGLGVEFHAAGGGAIEATFPCDIQYSGYAGYLHGGVISSLLDGAMTSCLMAQGRVAFTADLRVRFRKPVRIGYPAIVRARIVRSRHGVHLLEAMLRQNDEVKATAHAQFMAHTTDRIPQ